MSVPEQKQDNVQGGEEAKPEKVVSVAEATSPEHALDRTPESEKSPQTTNVTSPQTATTLTPSVSTANNDGISHIGTTAAQSLHESSSATTPSRTKTRSSAKARQTDAAQTGDKPMRRRSQLAATKPLSPDQPILARSSNKGYVFIPPNEYVNKRRVSSRSIKRKKFDDEVVECSMINRKGRDSPTDLLEDGMEEMEEGVIEPPTVPLAVATKPSPPPPKTAAKTIKQVKPPRTTPPAVPEVVAEKRQRKPAVKTEKPATASKPTTPTTPDLPGKKKPKLTRQTSSTAKRTKKSRTSAPTAKELGKWRPEDDLALISAVQQTNDLEAVYQGVKFSKHFSMSEIEGRWYSLLYDQTVSTLAQQAMRTLHPDIKTDVLAKALFSEDEEKLLSKIGLASQPSLDTFQQLINKNVTIFHPSRTAKSLHAYWQLMKQYHLLPDQSVQPMPKGDHVLNFSDAEDLLDDNLLQDPRDDILEQELDQFDRRQKRQIQQLENEIPKWTVMVENVTGVSTQEFDTQTLAVLRGRLVRYLMRSKEITLGRASKDTSIDIDLTLEGPASKISRKQGIIKLKNNGDFYILNEGKRPIYVDGKPVISNQKSKLNNNAVVEIAGLRFIFLVNQDLISQMRGETSKPATAT